MLDISIATFPVIVFPVCLLIVPAPTCFREYCLRDPIRHPEVTLRLDRSGAQLILTTFYPASMSSSLEGVPSDVSRCVIPLGAASNVIGPHDSTIICDGMSSMIRS